MSAGAIRNALRVVAAAGIPGIIVGSIAGNDGIAITFGSITAVAAFGLILVTAVIDRPTEVDDARFGEAIEARIAALVAAGADETEVRKLVSDAVRLGRGFISA